jgi:hypothetical protein
VNTLAAVLRALTKLFVDDGSFALQVVVVVGLAEISIILFPKIPLEAGGILLIGCLGVLLANVSRASSR